MINPALASFRLLGFALLTLLGLPFYLVLLMVRVSWTAPFRQCYFKCLSWVCGFHIHCHGTPLVQRSPVLFVANHTSYFDIILLGSLLQASFVAKKDVAGWPIFGFLARIARTAFIDRNPRASATERNQLRERLAQGDSLILFPEGTSNDGNGVLQFKSALFSIAETLGAGDEPLMVQPVSLAYTRLDGRPLGRAFRPFYAWYGDMTLGGHLFAALGLGTATVEVLFHPPVSLRTFNNRKDLALHCQAVVARGVVGSLAGRPPQDLAA